MSGILSWKNQKSIVLFLVRKIKHEHKYQKMAYNMVRKALKHPKFIKNPKIFYQSLVEARGNNEVYILNCDPGLQILETILFGTIGV